jgi:hypothetical protein
MKIIIYVGGMDEKVKEKYMKMLESEDKRKEFVS